jgi:hypothetical protein
MWEHSMFCTRTTPSHGIQQTTTPTQLEKLHINHATWTLKMSCNEDHDHSGHSHGHGGGAHDHSDDLTPALQYSLYQHINFDDITTLNEADSNSGKAIVKKTWMERLQEQPELESDADEQLLIHIP